MCASMSSCGGTFVGRETVLMEAASPNTPTQLGPAFDLSSWLPDECFPPDLLWKHCSLSSATYGLLGAQI